MTSSSKKALIARISQDTNFLTKLNCIDYSILIGIQQLEGKSRRFNLGAKGGLQVL